MKRILLFGGGGFVGGNIASVARSQGWNVTIADPVRKKGLGEIDWRSADITDPASVQEVFEAVNPDAVVNTAAVASLDVAEANKESTFKINVEGAENIARACTESSARYLFFSSDAVYEGVGSGYAEMDEPAPVNYYGETKAEAETRIQAACPDAVIIRISLVLGFPVTSGNSFVAALEQKLAEGGEVPCPTDEVRTPIDVLTLSESVLELVSGSYSGIIHLGCTESIDRYRLTQRIARKMGHGVERIKPQAPAAPQPGRAPRHKNGIIDVSRAREMLSTPMLSLEGTINRAFEDRIFPTTD